MSRGVQSWSASRLLHDMGSLEWYFSQNAFLHPTSLQYMLFWICVSVSKNRLGESDLISGFLQKFHQIVRSLPLWASTSNLLSFSWTARLQALLSAPGRTTRSLLTLWLNPWHPKLRLPRSPSIILALQIVYLFRGHGSLTNSHRGHGGVRSCPRAFSIHRIWWWLKLYLAKGWAHEDISDETRTRKWRRRFGKRLRSIEWYELFMVFI